jgi:hypothetical protein
LAKHDRASVIVAYDMKRVLADIDTDGGNGGLDGLGHRRLLVVGTPCQLQLLAGQEHGRTIPLAEVKKTAHSITSLAQGAGSAGWSARAPWQ